MPVEAERNQYERLLSKADDQATGTLYYPGPLNTDPGIDHNGFIDASFFISAACGGGNTQTFTVEISDDGTTWIAITRNALDLVTNTDTNPSYVCPAAGTLQAKLQFTNLNTRYIRLLNAVVDGGAADNSATVIFRDSGLL